MQGLLNLDWIYTEPESPPQHALVVPANETVTQLHNLVQQGDIGAAETLAQTLSGDYPAFSTQVLSQLHMFHLRELRHWLGGL